MAAFTAVLLLALVGSSAAAQRQLLQTANPTFTNGDFAQPGAEALNPGGFATLSPQTPNVITGWVITAGDVDYVSTREWQAPPGAAYSVDVSGDRAGSIQQTFVTTPGANYTVTFYLAGSPAGTPVKTLVVSAAGTTSTYTFDITNATTTQMGYLPQTFSFVATDASTALVFTSQTNEQDGPVIGDVVVSGGGVTSPSAATNGTATNGTAINGTAISPSAAVNGTAGGPAAGPASSNVTAGATSVNGSLAGAPGSAANATAGAPSVNGSLAGAPAPAENATTGLGIGGLNGTSAAAPTANGSLAGTPGAAPAPASNASLLTPASAPGATAPIVASFIVPQPLSVVNTSQVFGNLTAGLTSEFGTPSTTPAITSIAAGPNPANETVVTFEMQPKTAGAAIPQEEQDNLRAAFTTIVENRDTLTLPAPYSPTSNFTVVSFPGGAGIITSAAPYGSPTANSTIGLLNFQLPRGINNVTENENLLLQQVATTLGLKPSEVLTAALAAVNGSTNATEVSTFLTTIGAFADSPARINELAGNISAAIRNGTLGLDPAVFGIPSNITLSPALTALLSSLPPGTTLAPGTILPPGTTLPPGTALPPGTTLPPGVSAGNSSAAAAAGTTPGASPGGAAKIGVTLVGVASAVLVAALF